MLYHVLDAVLGSTTKVRLLRVILPLTHGVTGREAQRLARVKSDGGAREALAELDALGILHRDYSPASNLYRINRDHELFAPLRLLFNAEAARAATLREMLREALAAAGQLSRTASVTLFGSAARGDTRPDSDADLFLIAADDAAVEPVRDAVLDAEELISRRTGLRISPLVLSLRRVRERYHDGDPLLQDIETQGRLLLGQPLQQLAGGP